jgi:hypothetical protein
MLDTGDARLALGAMESREGERDILRDRQTG